MDSLMGWDLTWLTLFVSLVLLAKLQNSFVSKERERKINEDECISFNGGILAAAFIMQ